MAHCQTGTFVPQDEGHEIRQDELHLSVSRFDVQRVHASSVDLNQHVVVPDRRDRHLGGPYGVVASVAVDDECPHAATTYFRRVLRRNTVWRRLRLIGQILMHKRDSHAALTHAGSHAFDGTGANVADGKDARNRGFE